MNPLNGLIIVILLTLGFEAQTALYKFIPKYPELSIDKPGTAGIDHFIDRSDFFVFYDDEGIHYSGTFKMTWSKKKGGRVTSLLFSARTEKIIQFLRGFIDQVSTSKIKYRHSAFTAKAHGQAFINMEGRYKVVTFFRAYDEHNTLRPEVICLEIPGDIIKI